MTYSNAGHNPPILNRGNGEALWLDGRHGPVLGASPGLAYKEGTIRLEKGDLLFMYTDGITEATNPEKALFGEDRLLNLVGNRDRANVEGVVQDVIGVVKSFENGAHQFDDITVLALQYHHDPGIGTPRRVEMTIGSDPAGVETVKARCDEFSEEIDLSEGIRRTLNLVLDELISNIISYAYGDDESHEILLTFELTGGRLTVSITDDGIPFNPFEAEPPDTTLGPEERPIGGLGIHLVRSLVDRATYQRRVDKNVVMLVKDVSAEKTAMPRP